MIRLVAQLCVVFAMLLAAYSAQAAPYIVTKIADTNDSMCDADCSLREAVAAANGTVDNDIIAFALPLFSSPQMITLSGSEIVVANNGSLTIYGPGANRLTISGNGASRILVSGANVVVNIHNLRFTAGNGVGATNSGRGGAIYNVGGTMVLTNSVITGNSAANGGAMNNAASASPSVPANLTIVNCVISNNSSTSSGAALQNFSTSTVHIRNSTVNNNNTTSTGIAGAFQANGMVTISNSTFSGNTASGTGGGIYYNGTGLTLTNVTVAGNTSTLGSGGFHKATATLNANVRNSIFAGNTGAAGNGDAAGAVTSQGNNVIQTVGTSTGWVGSDLQNMDPLLTPLGFYGGFGMTHLPLSGSVAINAGHNCVLDLTCAAANPPIAITTDERGAARPFGATVDIGAVEVSGDYYAVLPSAGAQIFYSFTLVPVTNSFTYTVNSGGFGGMTLVSDTSATVIGNASPPGVYDALVHINRVGVGQAFHNFRINVLGDLNALRITGQVLTSSGEPVNRAYVTLAGFNGQTYNTISNAFGNFRFDGLPPGLTGTLTVANKKGLTFDPQVIVVVDVIDGLNLRALP
jgi:CSLREA domain-containing protein